MRERAHGSRVGDHSAYRPRVPCAFGCCHRRPDAVECFAPARGMASRRPMSTSSQPVPWRAAARTLTRRALRRFPPGAPALCRSASTRLLAIASWTTRCWCTASSFRQELLSQDYLSQELLSNEIRDQLPSKRPAVTNLTNRPAAVVVRSVKLVTGGLRR